MRTSIAADGAVVVAAGALVGAIDDAGVLLVGPALVVAPPGDVVDAAGWVAPGAVEALDEVGWVVGASEAEAEVAELVEVRAAPPPPDPQAARPTVKTRLQRTPGDRGACMTPHSLSAAAGEHRASGGSMVRLGWWVR